MKRRSVAAIVATLLVVGLVVVAVLRPVPYVTFAPGPTVNVLGNNGKDPIIEVSGHTAYRDKGALRLLTVIPSGPQERVSLAQMMLAWVDPDKSVYPYKAIYGSGDTQKAVQQQSTAQMDTSQSDAVAAAMGALKVPYTTYAQIGSVQDGGPADGKLKPADRILRANGTKVTTFDQLAKIIRPLPIGSPLTMTVRRGGKVLTERMRTVKSPASPKASAILVTVAPGYNFPFDVKLNIDKNIGGPSGGLMFSMGIYDVLTPGSLTGGKVIAGTGEIDSKGNVAPIGGIQQKMVAAQDAGAKLFLSPADNCAEALEGNYDPKKMHLVKVERLSGAIADVRAWVKNPNVALPRCTHG
jgi:PDZ domain-containing protein